MLIRPSSCLGSLVRSPRVFDTRNTLPRDLKCCVLRKQPDSLFQARRVVSPRGSVGFCRGRSQGDLELEATLLIMQGPTKGDGSDCRLSNFLYVCPYLLSRVSSSLAFSYVVLAMGIWALVRPGTICAKS